MEQLRGGATKTVDVSAKPTSAEYSGSFNVTYSIKSKTDLSTLGQPIECTFTSQPTNKQVLQAFVAANPSISINQIDINTNATKTIVANKAFSYEIIPASFSSTVSGSVKIVVHKPYQTIPISALIPNTYISIFDTPTTNASDIKAQVKYWNDYYINDQIASALQLMTISYNRTYEGQTTVSLSATYSFITGSIQLTWMYVPPNSYIKRGPGATTTTAWDLTTNFTSSTLSLERDKTIDCFVNNNNLTSFTAVVNHPIIRVCDLTHTSVQTGNIGYNSGHPSQTDDGYQACLYPIKDTSPNSLFYNHMNCSMKKAYVMSKESGNTRIAVFGDPNLTDIWCKKPAGNVYCSCFPGSSRPCCSPSYIVHLPYGSTCTFSGTVTENYPDDTGDTNSAKLYMSEYQSIFPQYASDNTYYNNRAINFQYVYDF
ncbi:MAG: hypothetical protein LBG49_00115 [Mycoplasmataceae bacterium]|nr:hypothetical protein [Mycoplasmataceae bacterium]